MTTRIRWTQEGHTRAALVAGPDWLGPALAEHLSGEMVDGGASHDVSAPAILVAWRGALAQVSDAALRALRLAVLLDPTDHDRLRVIRALSGRQEARLTQIPSPETLAAAEHTMLLMLATVRRLLNAYSDLVTGVRRAGVSSRLTGPETSAPNWVGLEPAPILHGKTLGILGLGRVGEAVAARAVAFGMRVIYHDRERKPAAELRHGLTPRRFDQLLREADVVSLHLPLEPETVRIIDAPELAQMKPDAYLINTAHGRLVDEGSLIRALRARDIAGAGLDVFAYEALPADSPLLALDNVVLTPHIAGMAAEAANRALVAEAADVLLRADD